MKIDGGCHCGFITYKAEIDPCKVLVAPFAVGLDTGCCFGGRLTAAVVELRSDAPAARFVSVPARERYAVLSEDD